jgi:hypothetical protein
VVKRTSSSGSVRLAACGAALLAAAIAAAPAAAPPRLVAVGDIHGDLAAFRGILRAAGLVDGRDGWTGGGAVLVQTGDYTDRGADVRQVMDLLRALESRARGRGGRVEALLGNHEVMNLLVHHRDVNPAAYAPFADSGSERRRERAFEAYVELAAERTKALGAPAPVYALTREAWRAAYPPGRLEYIAALGPGGSYGRWLRDRQVAVTVDRTVLMHAGLDPAAAPESIDALNRAIRDEIRQYDDARAYLVDRRLILPFFTLQDVTAAVGAEVEALQAGKYAAPDERHLKVLSAVLALGTSPLLKGDGPLWYRGFATWTEEEGAAAIAPLLARYGADRFVVGHTVQNSRGILARFEGRVFLIDTGMLASVYKGRASALEIAAGAATAIYPDQRVLLVPAPQRVGAPDR